MAKPARLIEGGTRPVARARFSPLKLMPDAFPWHSAKWSAMPSRLLWSGDRRMEAESFLLSGYGLKLAIETKAAGWVPLGDCAKVSQPPRTKATLVSPGHGQPFLQANQMFSIRPFARKWLAVGKLAHASELYAPEGTILVRRSADVGRMVVTLKHHEGHLISDHFFRVESQPEWKGWLVAYLRCKNGRAIMSGQKYGHIIKHIEIPHFRALPVPEVSAAWRAWFNTALAEILRMRNAAHAATLEAERVFEEAVTPLRTGTAGESGFTVRASALLSGRRRLDGLPHNPHCSAVVKHLRKRANSMTSIREAGFKVWVPGRYKRIPAEDGIDYLDSSDLFEINPDIQKRFADCGFGDSHGGRVQPGWLLVACSGQVYGVNGSCTISGAWLNGKAVSNHVLRVAPTVKSAFRIGYLAVVLGHPTLGRPRVKSLAFGSSIPEIEMEDFANLEIPRLPKETEDRIADLAEEAAALRSEADLLENRIAAEADHLIEAFIAGEDLAAIPAPARVEGKIASSVPGAYSAPETTEPMRGIEKTPGVNGGDACIARTRIPVWVLEEMRRAGAGQAEILADFPGLTAAQLAQAWAYVKKHAAEIEEALTAHAGA